MLRLYSSRKSSFKVLSCPWYQRSKLSMLECQRVRVNHSMYTTCVSLSSSSSSLSTGPPITASEVWEWVPPEDSESQRKDKQKAKGFVIPAIKGELLLPKEVQLYLEGQGAEDVKILHLKEPIGSIEHFIFATGRSLRHINKMSQSIVSALKERDLTTVGGFSGAEGGRDDDWHLVNCGSFAVHIMGKEVRRMLDLERHWSAKSRPFAQLSGNERSDDAQFLELLEQHPVPDGYLERYSSQQSSSDRDSQSGLLYDSPFSIDGSAADIVVKEL